MIKEIENVFGFSVNNKNINFRFNDKMGYINLSFTKNKLFTKSIDIFTQKNNKNKCELLDDIGAFYFKDIEILDKKYKVMFEALENTKGKLSLKDKEPKVYRNVFID